MKVSSTKAENFIPVEIKIILESQREADLLLFMVTAYRNEILYHEINQFSSPLRMALIKSAGAKEI